MDPRFTEELIQLRKKRLSQTNEIQIQRTVLAASSQLEMPPALLWCLLFQESRLNHLDGIGETTGALGLGQFSHFSFQEINMDLTKFGTANLNLFVKTFGKDIRPISANEHNTADRSSYYFIPTAVVSTAAYLNNRQLHLKTILDKQQIRYQTDILWLYAAMAYNKGTRSVLSLWTQIRKKRGPSGLEAALTDPEHFFSYSSNPTLLSKSLKRIWTPEDAHRYSAELAVHTANLASCSLDLPEASRAN